MNGLTVGFKKALLTFGYVDQEKQLYCIMRVKTEGELIVYIQLAKKRAIKLFPGRARLSYDNWNWKKNTHAEFFSNAVNKHLHS